MLIQIDGEGIVGGIGEYVPFLGHGFGKEFGHAVELGADAVEALGDADGVVEGGGGGVVSVGVFGGVKLVEV